MTKKIPDNDDLAPLLWCINFIVSSSSIYLDNYLRGILGGDSNYLSSGEGWLLERDRCSDRGIIYYAWSSPFIGLEPNEGDYDEKLVKYHIRQGLENVLKEQPSRRKEIEQIFRKYDL